MFIFLSVSRGGHERMRA